MNAKTQKILASYGRSALGAALAVYLANPNDVTVRDVVAAALAAVLPPLLRWLNPKDAAFGRSTS